MKKGDNIRLRADGRYEARYIKSRDENGKRKTKSRNEVRECKTKRRIKRRTKDRK